MLLGRRGAGLRRARLVWLVCLGSLQGCTAFASRQDTLGDGEDTSLRGRDAVLTTPALETPSETLSAMPEPGTGSLDAGTGSLPEAGVAVGPTPDAGSATGGAPSESCDGPGEFPGASGIDCFQLVEQSATWSDAQAACARWGGALARVASAEIDELLGEHLSADVWISASDLAVEGQFVWSDGTPLGFTSWAEEQPDDFEGGEDCVEKLQRNQLWNDQQCSKQNAFFCQR